MLRNIQPMFCLGHVLMVAAMVQLFIVNGFEVACLQLYDAGCW